MAIGDPACSNSPGRRARLMLDDLESRTASIMGGSTAIFLGSGAMAGAMAVLSAGRAALSRGRPGVVASSLEPSPVVSALRMLRGEGCRISILEAGADCRVSPGALVDLITEDTGLVVCSWACGESGVMQPMEEISGICREKGAWLHTDASNVVGRIPVNAAGEGIDSLTIDSLKLGGPSGAAAVVLGDIQGLPLEGVPEFTLDTSIPSVCGMVAALECSIAGIEAWSRIVNGMRSDIFSGLDSCGLRYSIIGGSRDALVPGAAMVFVDSPEGRLHAEMEMEGVVLPSYNSPRRLSFLRRTGLDMTHPDRYVGFSLDSRNTGVDVERFVRSMSRAAG